MDIFNNVIWWVNIAIIIIFGSFFIFQILFMIFFFLKPRRYPKAKKIHDFTFIIRANNEEDVITDCVKSCLSVKYPKNKFRVIVFAHNCTDKTAVLAKRAGAEVVEIHDENPDHKKASYCMYHGMQKLKKNAKRYEYFLLIDADNQVDKNYLNACNDAADDGVLLGRTFENSKNLTDNTISCMSGLWYLRDSRIACGGRSAFHLSCVMNGCCSMIKSEYCFDWDAMSTSDDIEFTLNRLIKDQLKVEYISEATLYEDQPTTLDDIFKRNSRMGGGLNKLFWSTGIKCLWLFIKNLFNPKMKMSMKFAYLDQFFNIATVPGSFVIAFWIPLYYIYSLIYTGVVGPITIYGLGSYNFMWFLIFILSVAGALYLIPFWVQPLVAYISERKRLPVTNKKLVATSIILFPSFMIIQLVAIVKGMLVKAKWEKIKRSKSKI